MPRATVKSNLHNALEELTNARDRQSIESNKIHRKRIFNSIGFIEEALALMEDNKEDWEE